MSQPHDEGEGFEVVPVGTLLINVADIVDFIEDELVKIGLVPDPEHIFKVIMLYNYYMEMAVVQYLQDKGFTDETVPHDGQG